MFDHSGGLGVKAPTMSAMAPSVVWPCLTLLLAVQ